MKTTPFTEKHIALGAKMHEFAGYNMPIEYSGIIDEHITVCQGVGVFDVSHMGEFWVKGPQALAFLQKITSNNVAALAPGKIQYTCFPNEDGGIVDDLLVYQYEPEKYMLVVNASNMEKDWNWCVSHNTEGAELENSSDNIAQLAIQGPKAISVLQKLTDIDLATIPYYTFKVGTFAGEENVIISNTGYTGAGGFELYFYPSVASSVVLSQFIPMPKFIDFWKVRGAWTQTKSDLGVYDTNNTYSVSTDLWNGESAAYYPTSIRGVAVKPSATRSYEIGTAVHMFKNRLKVDFTYYNKLYYNLTRSAGISNSSGFTSTLINIDEEYVGRGVELTLSGDIIRTRDWNWESAFNWSRDRWYYTKIDPVYSTQKPWVAVGKRWDWYGIYDWERDPQGNIINYNGYPKQSDYQSVIGYEYPDWIWGWTNTITYKNFTLSFTLDGRVGGMAHSKTNQAMWNSGAHIDSDNQWRYDEVVNKKTNFVGTGVKVVSGSVDYDSNGKIIHDDRVFAPNDVQVSYESYMKSTNPYIGTVTRQNVFDETFFKLRDLSLSYQMPKSVCNKLHMKGLTLAFVGQNLFVWTKEFRFTDPDSDSDNLSSPSTRYLGFNVKLDF